MTSFTQDGRVGKLHTPLAKDKLLLMEFSGTEYINDISLFRVRAAALKDPVDLDLLLGKPMRIEMETKHGIRFFNLTVFSARFLGQKDDFLFYEFELRPWIWAMARRETSRIFPKKKVDVIIGEVLNEYKVFQHASHEFHVRPDLPELEYTVQYRETDLNFVRRLMEEYGINFHMKMEDQKQTLVMSDSTDGFVRVTGPSRAFRPTEGVHENENERVRSWLPQRMVTTGRVKMLDYDFTKSRTSMDSSQVENKTYSGANLESYDFPGRYTEQSEGQKLAKRRLDAFRTGDATVRADGNLMSLGAGRMFDLSEHTVASENGTYVCLSAHHHYVDGGYISSGSPSASYDGYYSVTKESAPIAPERLSPRGQIRGPHTAIVADGMDGNPDKYGRIIVKFHWDANQKSMPCRVSQMWAGPTWGTVFVPRAGMEVIVEFLEGDPDRPLIMGCLYNDVNMPPFPLPDKKQISGIKTQSMGGGGYNELIFDDTGGSEMIRAHAQKDMEVTIENNETRIVKQKQDTTVTADRNVTVKANETKKVTGVLSITSDTKIELKVGASSITIDQNGIKITTSLQLETSGSLMAKHTSSGMLQIEAPMVKIN